MLKVGEEESGSRSAYGFCQGDRGDMGRSRIPTLEVGAGRPARRHDHTTGDDGYGMKLLIVGQQS